MKLIKITRQCFLFYSIGRFIGQSRPDTTSESATSHQHKPACTLQLTIPSFKNTTLDHALLHCVVARSTGPSPPPLISPWEHPREWINADLIHLKKIIQDLEKTIGPDNFDTHMFDEDHLIYPVSLAPFRYPRISTCILYRERSYTYSPIRSTARRMTRTGVMRKSLDVPS